MAIIQPRSSKRFIGTPQANTAVALVSALAGRGARITIEAEGVTFFVHEDGTFYQFGPVPGRE